MFLSYYIVQPIPNPAAESAMLENLLPFTSYQLVIRTTNTSETLLQTDTIYFSTSGDVAVIITDDNNIYQRSLLLIEIETH